MATSATWADERRNDAEWQCLKPFHYTTVPHGTTYPAAANTKDGDAILALLTYLGVLGDENKTVDERRLALRMVVHIVGDLHQPLHNGRGCDVGGNAISVNYFAEETNLHTVWDERLIEAEELSYREFADQLNVDPTSVDTAVGVLMWMHEAHELLDTNVYGTKTGKYSDGTPCYCGACADDWTVFGGCQETTCAFTARDKVQLGYSYQGQNRDVVRRQLRRGGVRLASLLNAALGKGEQSQRWQDDAAEIEAMSGWNTKVLACTGERS